MVIAITVLDLSNVDFILQVWTCYLVHATRDPNINDLDKGFAWLCLI